MTEFMTHGGDECLVFVVRYNHKHGTDVGVFGNGESAEAWVCKIIREYARELDDEDQARVHRALEEGDYHDVWYEVMDESFDVDALPILVLKPTGMQKMEESIDDHRGNEGQDSGQAER